MSTYRRDFRNYASMLRDKRVLVVEDEVLVAMLVEEELADAGARVLGPASSVDEALQLVESAVLDGGLSAAVLDFNLNGEVVMPVANRLAALGVPFLFATGYSKDCNRGDHAAAPLLQKPFDPVALVAAVEGLALARIVGAKANQKAEVATFAAR